MYTTTFSLLAALASTEKRKENTENQQPAAQCFSTLQTCVRNELLPFLLQSSYPEKSRIAFAIERALHETNTLYTHPELLGNSCIGIICADATALPILEDLAIEPMPLWKENLKNNTIGTDFSLPVRLCPHTGTPRVTLTNMGGQTVVFKGGRTELLPEEQYCLMHMEDINPRDIASSLTYFTALKRKKSLYLIVSPEEFEHDGYATFFSHCDALLIAGKLQNEHCLQVLQDNFNAPLYFITQGAASIKYAQQHMEILNQGGRIAESVPLEQVPSLLDSLDRYVDRFTLHDRLMSELLAYTAYISSKVNQANKLKKPIQDNIIYSHSSYIEDLLSTKQQEWKTQIERYEKAQHTFSTIYSEVLKKAKTVEKALKQLAPRRSDEDQAVALHAGSLRPASMLRHIILRLLASGEIEQVKAYQRKFADLYPDQAFITGLYIQYDNTNIDECNRERLRWMPDSPEVLRAKIYFRDALQLTQHDCAEIAALLKHHKDADEKYFWACHLNEQYTKKKAESSAQTKDQRNKLFEQVVSAYTDAALAGSEDAMQELALYCSKEQHLEELRVIADIGNPAALYICSLTHYVHKEISDADRYLKLAAALRHPKALERMAEAYWKMCTSKEHISINKDYNYSLEFKDENALNAGIAMYEYLHANKNQEIQVHNVVERLAYLYFCSKKWEKSRNFLNTQPNTVEGKLCLSIMLKYGLGGNIDFDRSIKLIREAESMQGFFAATAQEIKKEWYQEELRKL